MSLEDDARRVAEVDQARAMQREAASADAQAVASFYLEQRKAGMSEEHAFTITHEWMVLSLSAEQEEAEDE